MRALAPLWLGLLLSSGCVVRELAELPPRPEVEELTDIAVDLNRDFDILFVIDSSKSMAGEQESLRANFPRIIDALDFPGLGLPSLHIGVITTDVGAGDNCPGDGDAGNMIQVGPGGCGGPRDPYISDVADDSGGRIVNYDGTLGDTFSCIANVGIKGCGFEQPLEAMKRALANDAENAGFLRPAANLAVIVISDEDDCSARDRTVFDPSQDDIDSQLGELSSFRCFEFGTECDPVDGGERSLGARSNCRAEDDSPYLESVSTYADYLRTLKGDPDQVFVATIAGNPTPVNVVQSPDVLERTLDPVCFVCPGGATSGCSANPAEPASALVNANPAVRLRAFTDQFGGAGNAQDICRYDAASDALDVGTSLANIADQLVPRIDSICLGADPLDTDDGQAGLQPECEVTEGAAAIPACADGGATPCFHIEENPVQCGATSSHLQLSIDRGGAPRPADAELSARCLLAPG